MKRRSRRDARPLTTNTRIMSNNSSRSTQGNRTHQNATRGQCRGTWRHSNPRHNTRTKCARNATFAPPEWAHKELGNHVFITGPNAPTKCHKTKLAIINHITKEMKNAEDIKWAMKHEEECDIEAEKSETKDNKGKDKTIDTSTAEGSLLKLEIEQHLKRKTICKSNKTIACGCIIGQCTQAMKNELEAREDWPIIEDNTQHGRNTQGHQGNNPQLSNIQTLHRNSLQSHQRLFCCQTRGQGTNSPICQTLQNMQGTNGRPPWENQHGTSHQINTWMHRSVRQRRPTKYY